MGESAMYICLCFGVTDKTIKQTVAESETCSIRQLTKKLGFGTQCGKCLCHTKTLMEETRQCLSQDHQREAAPAIA